MGGCQASENPAKYGFLRIRRSTQQGPRKLAPRPSLGRLQALKAAPDMNTRKSAATDADILWYGIDRVVHTKTGGGHEKVDTYKDLGEALGKFQALRASMIEYIKTTDDDMRSHSFGDRQVIDCWQWMLEISTHAERHIQQIREIKNDPNFPRK